MKTNNSVMRTFCFVLIAIMTLSIMPFGLFDTVANAQTKSTEIADISINDANITPIAGKTAGECLAYTLPTDAPYTVTYYYWNNDTENTEMDSEAVFEIDNYYSRSWTLKAKDGYTFTENTAAVINGTEDNVDTYMTSIDESDATVFYVWSNSIEIDETSGKTPIETVSIDNADIIPTLGKTAGELIAYTIADDAPYTVTQSYWNNDTENVQMESNSVFEEDVDYSRNWTLKAKDGYFFTSDTTISINGSESKVDEYWSGIDDNDSTVFYVWSQSITVIDTSDKTPIEAITINDADIIPVLGKTAGELIAYTIPDDAPYTVEYNCWNNDTEAQEMEDDSVFEEDNIYSRGWKLVAKEGYTFTEYTSVLINGSEDNVDLEWTWIDDSDSTVYYVWTNPVELIGTGEKINIDTIDITDADITPILGKTPIEVFYSAVSADAPYTIEDIAYINITDSASMSSTDVFEADKEYSYGWLLKAKSGYTFTEDTKVLINGTADFVDAESSEIYETPRRFIVWTIPIKAVADSEKINIDTITISDVNTTPILGKASGECISYTLPDDALYKVTEYCWFDEATETKMDISSVFEADKQYSFGLIVKAKAGYTFTEATKVIINGIENNFDANYTIMDSDNNSLFYIWSVPTNAVEEAEFELGDVNLDGKVNTGDAVFILRQIAGAVTFTEEQTLLADFNKDGKVNTGDAVAILKYCVETKSNNSYINK